MKRLCKPVSLLLIMTMIVSLFTAIPFEVGAASGVNYIYRSWNGEEVVEEVRTCTSYIDLANRNGNRLRGGWYVVSHNMTISNRLYIDDYSEAVNIIICDGVTLTCPSGIMINGVSDLNIFGQTNGTGKIYSKLDSDTDSPGNTGALIQVDGRLNFHGGKMEVEPGAGRTSFSGAAIGGEKSQTAGTISIYGGEVKAISHYKGAAIGGGYKGGMGRLRIYDGKVTAESTSAAAIGNGEEGESTGSIEIFGGTIEARTYNFSAAIGGSEGTDGPSITISGGGVTACNNHSSNGGAAIGSGWKADRTKQIRISGGSVFATSTSGAAIGAGKEGDASGIVITGGTVTACASKGGAGIGGGYKGDGNSISISNANVNASSSCYSEASGFLDAIDKWLNSINFYTPLRTTKESLMGTAAAVIFITTVRNYVEMLADNESGCGIGGGYKGSFGTINISNCDSVTATSGDYAAAIGSGDEASSCGTINITNSTVNALAGTDAAAIGTGNETDQSATINITGSTVTAHGGGYGAGIGGGDDVSGGTINITDSTIREAKSGTDGAGIGGGEGGSGGSITITGSTVTAHGGGYGAGIGGGDDADGGTIVIRNSTVRAYGGTDAAGIGGGEGGDGGTIEIYDSDIYAEGVDNASGIGNGEDGDEARVRIFGNSTVEAWGGDDGGNALCIADNGVFFDYNVSLFINEDLRFYAGRNSDETIPYSGKSRYDAAWSNRYVKIYPCPHNKTVWRYDTVAYHTQFCEDCGYRFGTTSADHAWDSDNQCTVCGAKTVSTTLTLNERDNSGDKAVVMNVPDYSGVFLPDCENVPDGMEFIGWKFPDSNYRFYFPGEYYRGVHELVLEAVYLPVVYTNYIDANGKEKHVYARRITSLGEIMVDGGWYVVDSDVVLNYPIRLKGGFNLILADGHTLTNSIPGSRAAFMAETNDEIEMNVFGQAQQTGTLDLGSGGFRAPMYFNQFGGRIISTGSLASYNKSIFGGANESKTLLSNRNVKILGGTVKTGELRGGEDVLLGWNSPQDSITFDKINVNCTITVTEGQILKDEANNTYSGVLTSDQINAIQGKTLTPYIEHDYDAPEWVWDNEYTNATAVFRCKDCGDVQEVKAKVTCTDSGKNRTATARCLFYGQEFTTTQTFRIIFDIAVADAEHGTVTANKTTAHSGDNVDLEITPDDGYMLSELYYTDSAGDKTVIDGCSFTMPESDVTVTAAFEAGQEVEYIDENGAVQRVWALPVTNDTTELYAGWHYVDGSVTLQNNASVYGGVKLILCDSASLNGRLPVNQLGSSHATGDSALSVYRAPGENEGTLNISYISAGTLNLIGGSVSINRWIDAGTLDVKGGSLRSPKINVYGDFTLTGGSVHVDYTSSWALDCEGDINISSGALYASSDTGYAIIGGGNVTITGGDVEITGGLDADYGDTAVRVSGGNIAVNGGFNVLNAFITGGNLSISGQFYAYEDITLGWTELSDSIYAGSYSGAEHIYIAEGQELTDGTTLYSGSYDGSRRSIFNEKTLTPNFVQRVDRVEPYIDDYGAYIPGVIEHIAVGASHYAINADGSIGEMLPSVELTYFDFVLLSDDTYQIRRYTGAMDGIERLEIPKTFKGKAVTVIGESDQTFMNGTGEFSPFTLVLNENIRVIKGNAFSLNTYLTAVEGDTSGLSQIRDQAFMLSSGETPLILNLDYPGRITVDSGAFSWSNITARVRHATTLSGAGGASRITYVITDDAHAFGDPVWTWASDFSSASAAFTCTDSRCGHQETVEATVTESDEISKTVYTATAEIGGKTYTAVQEAEKTLGSITINCEHGTVSAGRDTAYEGEEITLTAEPDTGYKLTSLTVTDGSGNEVMISGNRFIMPGSNVSVTAVFEKNTHSIAYSAENGWVTGVYSANYGDEVGLTITPVSGYELDTLTVTDADENEIAVTDNRFIMPDSDVTVTVVFKKSDIAITYVSDGNGTVSGPDTAQFNDEVPLTVVPNEGYALWSLYAVEPEWNDPVDVIDGALYMIDSPVTVYAEFLPITPAQTPYIDDSGEYHLGHIEYCEIDGYRYAVKNGAVDATRPLNSTEVSYFEFIDLGSSYQVSYYTGPTDDLSELVIPKTFNGKPVAVLGNDINDAGDAKCRFIPQGTPSFKLVLTENITEIKPYSFYAVQITAVEGETPNLSKIGNYALSWANSRNGYTLDIRLDYPGKINAGVGIFNHMNVTARIRHMTTFSRSGFSEQSIDYIFTDAHPYGNPVWSWSQDNTSATAVFTCTDSRCRDKKTVEATVTSETKDGIITYTATAELDGKTYSDTKTAIADGIGARVVGHSISLDGDIAVNFYMELSDSVIAHKDTAYMHFTIPTAADMTEQDMLVNDATEVKSDGKTYYVFKCRVAAREMTSEITAQMIDGDLSGTLYTYSVKEYADYLIDHADESDEWSRAVPLVKAMLNYGAYSQIYFDINPGELANAGLTDDEKAVGVPEISIADPDESKLPDGVTFAGATLSLRSETSLSLYFKSSRTLSFSCDGYTVEKSESGGYQIARIRGISAKDIGGIRTLKIDGNEAVSYSPLNYCKIALDGGTTDENLLNVVKALYAYWQAAYAYFPE